MIPDLDGWLLELMEGQPPVPRRYELHCHPDVYLALRDVSDRQTFGSYLPSASLHTGTSLFGSAEIVGGAAPRLGRLGTARARPGGQERQAIARLVRPVSPAAATISAISGGKGGGALAIVIHQPGGHPMASQRALAAASLEAAVPQAAATMHALPGPVRQRLAADCSALLADHGDLAWLAVRAHEDHEGLTRLARGSLRWRAGQAASRTWA